MPLFLTALTKGKLISPSVSSEAPCAFAWYFSVKVISGHTYNYRQWREGDKIISEYVPESFVNSIKRKITIRKENEAALKEVKKELQSKVKYVVKKEILSEEEVAELREKARV